MDPKKKTARSHHFLLLSPPNQTYLGSVWIQLIFVETENWKHCSKIIFKCMNNTVGPVNSAWTVFFVPCSVNSCDVTVHARKKKKLKTWTWICAHLVLVLSPIFSHLLSVSHFSPPIKRTLNVRLDWDGKLKLFDYSTYFCYYSWVLWHFLYYSWVLLYYFN